MRSHAQMHRKSKQRKLRSRTFSAYFIREAALSSNLRIFSRVSPLFYTPMVVSMFLSGCNRGYVRETANDMFSRLSSSEESLATTRSRHTDLANNNKKSLSGTFFPTNPTLLL